MPEDLAQRQSWHSQHWPAFRSPRTLAGKLCRMKDSPTDYITYIICTESFVALSLPVSGWWGWVVVVGGGGGGWGWGWGGDGARDM